MPEGCDDHINESLTLYLYIELVHSWCVAVLLEPMRREIAPKGSVVLEFLA